MPHRDPGPDDEATDALLAARLLCDLRPLGPLSCRRLGRLRALFQPAAGADAPFALVRGGATFFKAGPETVTKYIARGMRPFPQHAGSAPLRGYWRVPQEVLDDADALCRWAGWAVDAARRFGGRPRRRRGPRVRPHPRDEGATGAANESGCD